MWICPVCDKENEEGNNCSSCGFDPSCNYEQYATVSPLQKELSSLSRRKKTRIDLRYPDRLVCNHCGSCRFRIRTENLEIVCADCEAVSNFQDILDQKEIEEKFPVVLPQKENNESLPYILDQKETEESFPYILQQKETLKNLHDTLHSKEADAAGDNWNQQGKTARTSVGIGKEHAAIVKKDGTVAARGSNSHGQCNTSDWKDITAVACGEYHTVGLKSDGTVVACGLNKNRQCNVKRWKNVRSILAGPTYTLAIRKDGMVYAAGCFPAENGESGSSISQEIKEWKDVVSLACYGNVIVGLHCWSLDRFCEEGADYASILTYDTKKRRFYKDTLHGWRPIVGIPNVAGYQGKWKGVISIVCNESYVYGLRTDGTIASCSLSHLPKDFECEETACWENITAIASSSGAIYAIQADGTIKTFFEKAHVWSLPYFRDILEIYAGIWFRSPIVGIDKDGTAHIESEDIALDTTIPDVLMVDPKEAIDRERRQKTDLLMKKMREEIRASSGKNSQS